MLSLEKSDQPLRLAYAHEAYVRAGDNHVGAAIALKELMLEIEDWSKTECKSLGFLESRVQFNFDRTQRGHRTSRRRRGLEYDDRRTQAIRSQVARTKSEMEDFGKKFELQLGSFLFEMCQKSHCDRFCSEYCVSRTSEQTQRTCVAAFEQRYAGNNEVFDWWTMSPLATLAVFLHAKQQWAEATELYRKAIDNLHRCMIDERRKMELLTWLTAEAMLCTQQKRPTQGSYLPTGKPDNQTPRIRGEKLILACKEGV